MLGLKRGTVKLIPYHRKWTELYNKEKENLIKIFGSDILGIEHIGSTAVPGLTAKPIIDVNIGVKSLDVARGMKNKLKRLGYEFRPRNPNRSRGDRNWRVLYVKGPEAKRTFYVHVSVYGRSYWKRNLIFRDYLRRHPKWAHQYASLKMKLANQYPDDRPSYTKRKSEFIRKTIRLAKKAVS